VGQLIAFVYAAGFRIDLGRGMSARHSRLSGMRSTTQASSIACIATGSPVDLQLFKDGVYLTDPAAYKIRGEYWKTLDPSCRWGGDFTTVDADHFQ